MKASNLELANAYWEACIKPKRQNVAPSDAKRRVFMAVEAVGDLDLTTASETDIYNAIKEFDPAKQRRIADRLNSIFKWKGLQTKVHTPRVTKSDPVYITLDDLLKLQFPVKEWELCVKAGFATGARYAELFTITPESLKENGSHVSIAGQIKLDSKFHETKNRKTGITFAIPELRDAVRQWSEVPQSVKLEMRQKQQPGRQLKAVSERILGVEVTFPVLRHSYARYMLTRNEGRALERDAATLEDLRQYLRDRIQTVEMSYANWIVSNSMMRANLKRFG